MAAAAQAAVTTAASALTQAVPRTYLTRLTSQHDHRSSANIVARPF
jgi:hypothetical protein